MTRLLALLWRRFDAWFANPPALAVVEQIQLRRWTDTLPNALEGVGTFPCCRCCSRFLPHACKDTHRTPCEQPRCQEATP